MKKIWLIGWKDLTLAFRDTAALIMMLAAPFALTLGLGFVTGRFSGSANTGIGDIPVVLVNQDGDLVGNALVDLFRSEDLARLVTPAVVDDPGAARERVDADQAAAALIIPAGFTQSIISAPSPPASPPPGARGEPITLYANPTRPTGVGVIRTIVDEFVSRVEVGRVAAQVAVAQLAGQGLIGPQDAARLAAEIGARQAKDAGQSSITLRQASTGGQAPSFDPLAYMAPGMALLFLMFTVSNGGRTLLAERAQGTLPRLLVSPTPAWQVLAGKVLGIYLTGVAQMLILILASALLFRLSWGQPLGVLALVRGAVVGAVGWGMLITALARTPGQVTTVGSAVMLTFGILGGSFINPEYKPRWFVLLGKITPNAWSLDAFSTLARGCGLGDILEPVGALLVMGGVLFAVAAFIINRRGIAQP